MDDRRPLPPEHRLCLGGTTYRIVSHLGRGANALAYRAVYDDAALPDQLHPVLLRELFPWRPEGGIPGGRTAAWRWTPRPGTSSTSTGRAFSGGTGSTWRCAGPGRERCR